MIFTYAGILEELENQLSAKSEWRKTLFNGVYRRINEVVAYVINKFVYYTEFLNKESAWDLATRRESLMARTEYYWYNPHRKIGAEGTIELSSDADLSSGAIHSGATITIPKWTAFSDTDREAFVYSTEDTIYYQNTVGSIDIPVKEGVPKEVIFIAKGLASEQMTLNFDNIDNDEVYVYLVDENNTIINTFIRTEVDVEDKLYFINDLDNYYCKIKSSNSMDSVVITFGDGVKTTQLEANDRILIKYAETTGASGNITNQNTITRILSTLSQDLYVNNTSSIIGGDNIEAIESIRNSAPDLFNSGYRCGGYDDWVTILESDSRIYKALIWSTDDLADDTITVNQNKVFVVAIGSDGEELSATVQNDITLNTLKAIKSPTELISWQDLNKVFVVVKCEPTVTGVTTAIAETLINTAINDTYDILNSTFQQSVYNSKIISVIGEVSIVNYHSTDLYHGEKFEDTAGLYNQIIVVSATDADTDVLADQVWLLEDTIEVWARLDAGAGELEDAVRVAYETGDTLVGDNGYTVSTPTIVRNLNSITFSIDELVAQSNYEIMLIYKTQDGNGNFTNDIRLLEPQIITDVDVDYNQYTITIDS